MRDYSKRTGLPRAHRESLGGIRRPVEDPVNGCFVADISHMRLHTVLCRWPTQPA